MAKNLALKSKETVYVYDINDGAVKRLVEEHPHVKAVREPKEMLEKSSTIITMLPESEHVNKVYTSLYSSIEPKDRFIDSSTIDPIVSQSFATELRSRGAFAFDAPVSGGVVGAANGTLTFMVGGDEGFEDVKPVLSYMGKNIIHCGGNGTGQVVKLCNNMMLAISMMGVSETMLMGTKLGMDPQILASILNTSTGKCWSSEINNPYPGVVKTAPASREYQGGFSNKLMAKDLRLAMKAAESAHVDPVLGKMANSVYQDLDKNDDYKSLDFSSIFKVKKLTCICCLY